MVFDELLGIRNTKASSVTIAKPMTPKNLIVEALKEYTNILILLRLILVHNICEN